MYAGRNEEYYRTEYSSIVFLESWETLDGWF